MLKQFDKFVADLNGPYVMSDMWTSHLSGHRYDQISFTKLP